MGARDSTTVEGKTKLRASFQDTALGHLDTLHKEPPPLAERPTWMVLIQRPEQ